MTDLAALFAELFDDAALYPPGNAPIHEAVPAHAAHQLAWYADTVGPFVCGAPRLPALDEARAANRLDSLRVSVVVPDGLAGLEAAVRMCDRFPHLDRTAFEIPVAARELPHALHRLDALAGRVFVEIPVRELTERHAHDLRSAGLQLKMRTGGTTIDAFATEEELARALVMCAAERLMFKCTAGLHHAVRHRDRETLFEHHGFLNIALASRVAAAMGNVGRTQRMLAEKDPRAVAYHVGDLDDHDIVAIRAQFHSFGTCSIAEPIADLVELGMVRVP